MTPKVYVELGNEERTSRYSMISTLASRYVPIMKSYNFPVLQNAAVPRALSCPSCALSVLTH